MAREGLCSQLRVTNQCASDDKHRTLVTGARVESNGSPIDANIAVLPVRGEGAGYLFVSFIDEAKREPRPTGQGKSAADVSRIVELEQELESMCVELKSAIRELEITNEEHKAINEEAVSVNEEFQSTNEELETSKEELQSECHPNYCGES